MATVSSSQARPRQPGQASAARRPAAAAVAGSAGHGWAGRAFRSAAAIRRLTTPGYAEGFLDGIVESWVAPIAAALVEAGADEPTGRADARLAVAVVRGLLLDLLATGDRAGTTAAYERFLQLASPSRPSAP